MAEQKNGGPMGGGPRGPMGGGPRGMMPGEKAKDFKGTMGKLISYLGKYLPAIIAVMLFAIASTVFSIIGPKILGNATTELFNGIIAQLTGTGGIDFEAVARAIHDTDALEYTRQAARDEAEKAREQLLAFPPSEATESLLKFCSFAVDRDR